MDKIENVKDFWISVGPSGAYTKDASKYGEPFGLYDTYGILIKHAPFSVMPKIKNVVVQSWKDEDGDDVWLPKRSGGDSAITHEAVDYNPTFVIFNREDEKGHVIYANDMIAELIKRIEGRWLKISDEYTQIGYEGAYLLDVDDDPKFKRRNYDYVEFSLKFRINGTNVIAPFKSETEPVE